MFVSIAERKTNLTSPPAGTSDQHVEAAVSTRFGWKQQPGGKYSVAYFHFRSALT